MTTKRYALRIDQSDLAPFAHDDDYARAFRTFAFVVAAASFDNVVIVPIRDAFFANDIALEFDASDIDARRYESTFDCELDIA